MVTEYIDDLLRFLDDERHGFVPSSAFELSVSANLRVGQTVRVVDRVPAWCLLV